MDTYQLHVAKEDGETAMVHITSPDGLDSRITLDEARSSKTLACLLTAREPHMMFKISTKFPACSLETWLRCTAVTDLNSTQTCRTLPTEKLVEFIQRRTLGCMQACDYFVDEKRLKVACGILGRRLFCPEQVLKRLSDDLVLRVLQESPQGMLGHMLPLLPQQQHILAVLACFPTLSSQHTLSLNCEQFPTATLVSTLATLASLPPLSHLHVHHISFDDHCIHCATQDLMCAVTRACMRPKRVSLGFGRGYRANLESDMFKALKANSALTKLTISKPARPRYDNSCENFELSGVEQLIGLQSLVVASTDGDSWDRDDQGFTLPEGLSQLSRLTELRFSNCRLFNSEVLEASMPLCKNLRVFELAGRSPIMWKVYPEAVAASIIRAASQLPHLSEIVVGSDSDVFSAAVGHLHVFPSLRTCMIEHVSLVGHMSDDAQARLAHALQNMPQLEELSLKVQVWWSSTELLPLMDALEIAGICQSCTLLHVETLDVPDDEVNADEAREVCDRLLRLSNLRSLSFIGPLVTHCDDTATLRALAASLRNLTYLRILYASGWCKDLQEVSVVPFLQTVLPELTLLQHFEIGKGFAWDGAYEQPGVVSVIQQNLELRHLAIRHEFDSDDDGFDPDYDEILPHVAERNLNVSKQCAEDLSSLTLLTHIVWAVNCRDAGDHNGKQQMYSAFLRSLGHLTNLQVLDVWAELSCCDIFRELLPQSITKLQLLQNLTLCDSQSGKYDWCTLMQALALIGALRELDLKGHGLFDDKEAASIAISLAALTNLEKISLTLPMLSRSVSEDSSCTILPRASCQGVGTIANALSKLPKLQRVSLLLDPKSISSDEADCDEADSDEADCIREILRTAPSCQHDADMRVGFQCFI